MSALAAKLHLTKMDRLRGLMIVLTLAGLGVSA
jgi:hypothetical protein